MATCQNELEFTFARFAKDRNRLLITESTCIIFQLLVVTLVPCGVHNRLEYLRDQLTLLIGVEIIIDFWLGDIPVIGYETSQQASFVILVIPVKADRFFLVIVEC